MKSTTSPPEPIYQTVADRLAGLIGAGTFRAGDRLPSVRALSRDWRVSITTVLGAYSLLEDRGIVMPRSRSGYYVRPRPVTRERLPRPLSGKREPVDVSLAGITEQIMDAASAPGVVPFGAAVPTEEIFPSARLATLFGSVVRAAQAPARSRSSMPPGRRELRVQIAKRLLGAGIAVAPDEIMTTSGAIDAVLLALRATCEPGDLVAVESPTYFGILSMVQELGLKVIELPVRSVGGVSVDAVAEAFAGHPVKACVLQPNFQNPVGAVISDTDKKQIVGLAAASGVTLIEDDLYGDLHFGAERPRALKAFDPGDTVIHCGSYSKALAPGLRVGWIVAGSRFHRIKRLKYAHSLANATASELVLAEYLKSGGVDRHLRKVRRTFAQQTQQIREALIDIFPAGIRVANPTGGFVLWCEMPPGFDSERFALAALARRISVVPGTLFSASCGLRHCFRISCGFPLDDRARRALGILGKLAADQQAV